MKRVVLFLNSLKSKLLKARSNDPREDDALTLLEMLMCITIAGIVILAAVVTLTQLSQHVNDHREKYFAHAQAQNILDMMTPELRMIGNGVPFHQTNFLIGNTTLSDPTVAEPVLFPPSTAKRIKFRLNETGEIYM